MSFQSITTIYFVLLILISVSCIDDNAIDPEVAALYTTTDRLKPLREYTEEKPREWAPIADEHIPMAKYTTNKGREAVVIKVPLKKATMEHYIERIGILDEKGKELVSEALLRQPNPRTHVFFNLSDLPSNKSKLKIYAKCNLHHLWTVPLSDAKWKE